MKLIFIFLFLISSFGFSQKISFVTYGTNEGLPQSQVTSIVQDKDGYLWVGTLGGLARFNGKDFVTFSSTDGLLNNRISSLEIIDGEIWIGHEGGVSKISKNTVKNWAFDTKDKIYKVTKIQKIKKRIIFSTNGAGLFEFSNSKLKHIQTKGAKTAFISNMQLYKNELYLCNENEIFRTTNLVNFTSIDALKSEYIYDFQIKDDKILIASFDESFVEYSLIKERKTIRNVPLNFFTEKIFLGKQDDVWLVSSNRIIHRYNTSKSELFDETTGLSFPKINIVFEDNNGNYWLGTSGKGLVSFPTQKIVYYDQSNGFTSDLVTNINKDNYQNFWFSSFDKGLFKRSYNGKISFVTKLSDRIWTSALDVDNANWFGSENGLIQIKNSRIKIIENENLPGWKITSLFKISSNEMLIGGVEGLTRYKNGKFAQLKNSKHKKFEIGTVNAIEIINDKIYCATDKGLFLYKEGNFTNFSTINNSVYCLSKDESNSLWIGTEEGLYIYKNSKISRVSTLTDPASNFILFINIIDRKIYFGTNNGVFIYDPYSHNLQHIGKKEGLVDLECNIKSSFVDLKKRKLWFGTASGTVEYDYEKSKFQAFKPQLIINKILLNQQEFNYQKYSQSINDYGIPNNLKLPYSKNNLTIILDGINMEDHEDLMYQYWIEGLEENWSIPTKNPFINFTGLPSGEFRIHFKCISERSKLSSKEIILPLIIKTPFYKTIWFLFLTIISISFIIYLFVKLKIKRETEKSYNETLEYKSKLMALEQKSLNASMNRHFIFNSLNSIQYFINSQDRLSANRYLTNFAKLIRKNLDSTVEEGSMITLNQELEGLELYLSLEAMRFKDRFEYEINLENVDTESIKVPSMLLQPFIENSIIHGILPNESRKGKITLNIHAENNLLIIQLDDNGVGIDMSQSLKKDTGGDHKSQGMEITSKRIDLIKKLSNQQFELIGPFQIIDNNRLINGTRVLLKIPFNNLDY